MAGKAKDCAECGLLSDVIALPEETTEAALLEKIAALNADKTVHGVLVQLPLPGHIREKARHRRHLAGQGRGRLHPSERGPHGHWCMQQHCP